MYYSPPFLSPANIHKHKQIVLQTYTNRKYSHTLLFAENLFLKSDRLSNPRDNKPIFSIRINTIDAYRHLKNTDRDSTYDVENGQAEADDVENRQDHELEEMLTYGNG